MDNLIFKFSTLTDKSPAAKQVVRYFARAGANVVHMDIPTAIKRSMGITYKEIFLTFADSQQVTMRVKQSGDVFQVRLNGKALPIKHQDDHVQAIAEIAQAMDAGRSRFQKLMARVKVRLPLGIRTSAPTMEQALVAKRDALKAAIADVRGQIEKWNAVAV
jgi:Asp-tRNA(Asn)/Glu-tRNA(Gln) amidotransferase A subunit family amidase